GPHGCEPLGDSPVVGLAAKLLGQTGEESTLFGAKDDGINPAEPRPIRGAREELRVPADGAGFERLALGFRYCGHGALERAIGRKHDAIALDPRKSQREEAAS